jgi:hypothetical protein
MNNFYNSKKLKTALQLLFGDLIERVEVEIHESNMETYKTVDKYINKRFTFNEDRFDFSKETIRVTFNNGRCIIFTSSEWSEMIRDKKNETYRANIQ